MNDEERDYFDRLAELLAGSIVASQQIVRFTTNKDVIGAYTESLVFQFVSRILHPLKISSGTVIVPGNAIDTPQVDLIVWDPNPIPPIIAEDRFALVPRNSVLALLEVKKTDYSRGLKDIECKSQVANLFLPPDCQDLFLGVVCARVKHNPKGNNKLARLLNTRRAVYLLDFKGKIPVVNPAGVYSLINFLCMVRDREQKRKALYRVKYPGASF